MATNLQVRTGNKITVKINGKDVGLIQSIRSSDNYGLQEASGIGDIHVTEYVPSTAMHSLSVQTMVLYKNSLLQAGVSPENGDIVLTGLVFDIVITDKDKGVLRTYLSCSYDSGDLEVSAHKIVSANCQFKALNVTGVPG